MMEFLRGGLDVEVRRAPRLNENVLTNLVFGDRDPDAPTVGEMRRDYSGLIQTLIDLRADETGTGMLRMEVERRLTREETEPIEGHPWLGLLRNPSPYFDPRTVWKWMQQMKDMGRGAFFVVERDGIGAPLYLHPVFPTFGQMRPVPKRDGGIAGYVFQPNFGGELLPFRREDVLWIRRMHPVSPYESASLLEAAAVQIDVYQYLQHYRREDVRSGGIPNLYIVSQGVNQKRAEEVRDRFMERYLPDRRTGVRKQRVPVFNTLTDIKQLSVSARDLEFVKGAELNKSDLYEIFRVPEGMLRSMENRSESESARYVFFQNTIQHEVVDNASQMTEQFEDIWSTPLDIRGRILITVPDLVPLDPAVQLRRDRFEIDAAVTTRDEIRARDGRSPLEGGMGEAPTVTGIVTPLEDALAGEARKRPQGRPRENAGGNDGGRTVGRAGSTDSEVRYGGTRQDDDEDEEASTTDYWIERERERMVVEGAVTTEVEDWLDEVLIGLIGAGLLIDRAAIQSSFRGIMEEGAALGMEGGWRNVQRELELESATLRPTSPFFRDTVWRLVDASSGVPGEVADGIIERIEENAGLPKSEVEQIVTDHVDDLKATKARQVGRTVATGSVEAGRLSRMREGGIWGRMWISQRDAAVRPSHTAIDGQRRAVDAPFSNGVLFPGDPAGPAEEIVNCRCTTLPITDEPARSGTRDWREERNERIVERFDELEGSMPDNFIYRKIHEEGVDIGDGERQHLAERTIQKIVKGY